ncbi:MAG: PilZ domain-containing protein [Gammaproteobacteria bacterium]|nr:PilZ domain-containing protein [Gammaproteobacteria bacterium]
MIKLFNKDDDTGASAESELPPAVDRLNKLHKIHSYYPIGARVHYYPEFHENIVLDSILIAYLVDGNIFYSDSEISWKESGKRKIMVFTTEGKKEQFDSIDEFQFVIPASGGSEEKLDYFSKETLGRNSGLSRGNNITIIADNRGSRLPIIQTTVSRRTLVKEGFYANQEVVLLDVDTNSFMLADQRSSYRLHTNLPVSIRVRETPDVLHCTLADFAEHSVRIIFSEDEPLATFISIDKTITLNLILPEQNKSFALRGHVFRRQPGHAVITLDMIEKNGAFSRMDTIDSLEVKTLLLQNAIASPDDIA